MIEIPGLTDTPDMIDFGDGKKTLFQLPVLGSKGVPLGVMSAIAILKETLDSGRLADDASVQRAWAFFIEVMADNYPQATRFLSRMDLEQFKHVVDNWFAKSTELGGFDPKAQPSSSS